MTVRIQDVARVANVSIATVSRVLNGRYGVSAETVQRVHKVIDELGYTSSLAAKSMRGSTNVIGVITFNLSLPFNTEVLRGIDEVVDEHGYDLLVYTSNRSSHSGDPTWGRKAVIQLNGTIVDGMIVITPQTNNLPSNHPLVAIEPCDEGSFPSILSTNRAVPVTVRLSALVSTTFHSDNSLVAAAGMLTLIPPVLLVFVLIRFIIRGLVDGVKF